MGISTSTYNWNQIYNNFKKIRPSIFFPKNWKKLFFFQNLKGISCFSKTCFLRKNIRVYWIFVFRKFKNHVLRPIDFNKNFQKWPFFCSITLTFWFWKISKFDPTIIIFRSNYDKKVNFVNFFSKKWAFFSFFWKKMTIFSNQI